MLTIIYITYMRKRTLSYYEKRGITSIIVLLLVYGSMFYDAVVYYGLKTPKEELLNFWGNQFRELFLCLIFVYVLVLFAFNRINRKITGEGRPKFKDERDNAIELKAIRASYYSLALGIFIAMLSAIWVDNYSPIFMIILASFLASSVVADIVRIMLYRKSS